MKFILSHAQADDVVQWASTHLKHDSHSDPALGGAYSITSIYLDTAEQDVFKRTKGYRQHKFRVRRYGTSHHLFLERKTKSNGQVSKIRSRIPEAELELLRRSDIDPDWTGVWFRDNLTKKRLAPAAIVRYRRRAFMGGLADKPVRLTLDDSIRFAPAAEFDFCHNEPSIVLVPDNVVLELKFCNSIPAAFKSLIADLRITPGSLSKYRHGMAVWTAAHSPVEGACA
jgi:hypothetical protein